MKDWGVLGKEVVRVFRKVVCQVNVIWVIDLYGCFFMGVEEQ